MMHYYDYPHPFPLERGGVLSALTIAYHTYGTMSPAGDNVVWVCHALTANSDVADWWPHTVESGRFLDPEKHFIVCANILGSHYGTTGPLSINPHTEAPWYDTFPALTIRDMVRAHRLLADHLGIRHIKALIGSSVGGFQAVEWAVSEPDFIGQLALIATAAKASPWLIAIEQSQRMAILADPTYGQPSPDAGKAGLSVARSIGLLTYRGPEGYNLTQQELDTTPKYDNFRASSYQSYQGEKLCRRFDAYSYMTIINATDTHDVGRNRGGVEMALKRITAQTLVVGISTDIVFTPKEMRALAEEIPASRYLEFDSPFGHDGFLVEHEILNQILLPWIG